VKGAQTDKRQADNLSKLTDGNDKQTERRGLNQGVEGGGKVDPLARLMLIS
jgi:hypothetical protein